MHIRTQTCIVTAILFGLVGCDSNPVTTDDPSPDVLGLQWVEALNKREPTDESMDVGSLGSGRDFFFLVTNKGDRPIRNIQVLLEEVEGFSLTPWRIERVDPGQHTGLDPLLRLSVAHGQTPDGLNEAPLLPQGDHQLNITLEGEMLDHSGANPETVRFETQVRLKVLVSAITISDESGLINLARWDWNLLSGGFEGHEWIRSFDVGDGLSILNSGNTPVETTIIPGKSSGLNESTRILEPAQSLSLPDSITFWARFAFSGAARDESLLPSVSNGYTYLQMDREKD